MKKTDKLRVEAYQKSLELAKSRGLANPFESEWEQKQAIERAKNDYAFMVKRYFPHYAAFDTPDFHIDFAKKVKANPAFKGFAQWGRGLAKSVVNNIMLPFWLWINEEQCYFVLIGNNYDRAAQLLDDIRAEFEANPQIQKDFGTQINPGNWESGFFITKSGFIGQAIGAGQSARGLRVKDKRPSHIVADDLETKDINKNPKRQREYAKWIEAEILPTMDGDVRRFVQANNKYAKRMIQTILQEEHPDWLVHQINAYDPVTYQPAWQGKYSATYYKSLETEIGIIAAKSEYNNDPHSEGTIFLESQIQFAKRPRLNQFKIIYGWWDVAYGGTATSDYNAVVVQGLYNPDFWVLDVFLKQCKMDEAISFMCQYQKSLPKTVMIHWVFEAQFWNDAVKDTIAVVEKKENIKLNIIKKNVAKVRKYDRILSLQPYYQNGRIFYDERLKSHNDAQQALSQLYGIEPGYSTHDDYPDAHQAGIAMLEPYVTNENGEYAEILMGDYKPSENLY
ncbi:MAG: hypothetical protein M9958_03260 [Chitinophagales bacterium]|nr:hypothetical protein [Chitinophagales bacterium]